MNAIPKPLNMKTLDGLPCHKNNQLINQSINCINDNVIEYK